MPQVNNCNLPDDLYYVVAKHVWARRDGDLVTVGMTDVAQNLAKTIIAVTPKAAGKLVQKGRNIATVESGKWVGPVPAPVSGEIVEVNQALATSPNSKIVVPYEAAGLVGAAQVLVDAMKDAGGTEDPAVSGNGRTPSPAG